MFVFEPEFMFKYDDDHGHTLLYSGYFQHYDHVQKSIILEHYYQNNDHDENQ